MPSTHDKHSKPHMGGKLKTVEAAFKKQRNGFVLTWQPRSHQKYAANKGDIKTNKTLAWGNSCTPCFTKRHLSLPDEMDRSGQW